MNAYHISDDMLDNLWSLVRWGPDPLASPRSPPTKAEALALTETRACPCRACPERTTCLAECPTFASYIAAPLNPVRAKAPRTLAQP